ncbi:MAG: hypothetical protein GY934_15925 [Gammaproteobacteria bacterium]|nr:hypothetical protein [Gammaproteobacteria bacterium]
MAVETINPLNSVASIADSVATGMDELFTSDDEREHARLLMQQELNKPHVIQAMTNLKEASHPSIFVAGWRPALGWLCVFLLAYAWIGRDILTLIMPYFDTLKGITLPAMEAGELMTLVMAMLGLGATRTYEKVQRVARNNMLESSTTPPPTPAVIQTQRVESTTDFTPQEKQSAFGDNDIFKRLGGDQ